MAEIRVRTRGNSSPNAKPRVYFTCHFDDFERYFDKICEDVFTVSEVDCAIYYTEDMKGPLDKTNIDVDLGRMNLFIVPVSYRLLNENCRAMSTDIAYAKAHNIPILPFMMESGIDAIYSREENFGDIQYLDPFCSDLTAISYEEKLKKYLHSVLISNELADRVRAAFDAYVFLSYRKKDRRHANELMRIIHNIPKCRDIAIWFDEFLAPGESFRSNIESAMTKSQLFTLLVTPNILEDGNFVMTEEYPMAIKAKISILAAEMEKTDVNDLQQRYIDLPDLLNPEDDNFGSYFLDCLTKMAKNENDAIPEHNYLIGLAYLDGIDVEVNPERGIELIKSAAKAELPEAVEKLYNMYFNGDKVPLNYNQALEYAECLVDYYTREQGLKHPNTIAALEKVSAVLCELENYSEAINIESKRCELCVEVFGEIHEKSTSCMYSLAHIYIKLNEYEKANMLMQRAFRLRFPNMDEYMKQEQLDEEVRKDIVPYMLTTAMIFSKLYDSKMALMIIQNFCEVISEMFGEKHIQTVNAKNVYAHSLIDNGNYDDALEVLVDIYEQRCELLSEKHPHAINTLNDIGKIYCHLGKTDEAFIIYQKVYDLRCEILGMEHPLVNETVECMKNLQPESLLPEKEREISSDVDEVMLLLEMRESVNTYTNMMTDVNEIQNLEYLNNLVDIYRTKKSADAEKLLKDKMIETLNKIASDEQKTKANEKYIQARRCYFDAEYSKVADILGGKHVAIALGESIYLERLNAYDENAKQTLDAKFDLMNCCFELSDYLLSMKYGEELIVPYRKAYGDDDENSASLMMAVALSAREIGDHNFAVSIWNELYDILLNRDGEGSEYVILAERSLAVEYKLADDLSTAIKWLERAYASMVRALGENHSKTQECLLTLEKWRENL